MSDETEIPRVVLPEITSSWWKRLFSKDSTPEYIQHFNVQLRKAISSAASYMRIAPFGKPVWTNYTVEDAIDNGYRASHIVYACVKKLADAASSVPFIVQERDKKGEWRNVTNHPLEQLLMRPNPFQTWQDLIERIVQHLNLAGNALLYKNVVGGRTVELWVINPDTLKPIPDESNFIAGYQFYKGSRKDDVLEPDKIIHLQFADPQNPFWGMSPLEAAQKIVDTEVEAVSWWKVSLQNRAVKDGLLSFKNPMGVDQYTAVREKVAEQLQGSANARGPIIIGEEVDYKPFSMSPVELDFTNSRKMTREDIMAVFGVPGILLNFTDGTTYANAREARKIFYIDTIMPLLEGIRAGLNRSLVSGFGDINKLRISIDLTAIDIFMDILADRAEAAERYFRMGVPLNMISNLMNLYIPPTPTGNFSFAPANMIAYGRDEEESASRALSYKSEKQPGLDNNNAI
ncbi:MAG: phage portal protein [Candidatus Riesia sp.]|nr:phage portal protein [Candidatus Riesia sp.]